MLGVLDNGPAPAPPTPPHPSPANPHTLQPFLPQPSPAPPRDPTLPYLTLPRPSSPRPAVGELLFQFSPPSPHPLFNTLHLHPPLLTFFHRLAFTFSTASHVSGPCLFPPPPARVSPARRREVVTWIVAVSPGDCSLAVSPPSLRTLALRSKLKQSRSKGRGAKGKRGEGEEGRS